MAALAEAHRRAQLDPTAAFPLGGPVRLRFCDPSVEREFRADYLVKTRSAMRSAFAAGIALYAAFGLLDASVVPGHLLGTIFFVRYAIVVPLLCLGLGLLFVPALRRHSIEIGSAGILVGGLGLVAIVTSSAHAPSLAYYAGFLLIDMFAYTVMQLPFVYASAIGWAVMGVYNLAAVARGVPLAEVVWQDFFLVSGNLAGMVGAWFIERLRRRDFAAQLVLARDRAKLVHLADELEAVAQRDPLTGLKNRRHLDEQLRHLLDLHHRYGVEASLLLVDLDDFKEVNDTHGHPAGDALLVACAGALGDCIRAADQVFRYGGDEFLVLAPETGEAVAERIGRRIQEAFADLDVPDLGGRVAVSCSVGICAVTAADTAPSDVLAAVDDALYGAKREGKGRVVTVATREPGAGR